MQSPTLPRHPGAASVTLCVARLQDIALAAAHGLLSATERRRALRITHRGARDEFVRTRGLLRLLLGRCTGRSPASLVLADASGEAPRLVGNRWGLHFNVSHSYEWAAAAAARFPVGVDIERVDARRDWQPIAEILFHPSERQRLQLTPPQGRAGFFFETWTRKEAYLKAIGTGLRLEPASFHTMSPDGNVVGAEPAGTWHTQPVHAPEGYVAALATPGPVLATELATALATRTLSRSADRLVDRIELADLIRNAQSAVDLVCERTHPI
jgi:4'-phosphopantetheinyl transferase